jgi:adenylosuccinate synthase
VLRYEHGIHDPFELLTLDENALVITSYHGIASRIRELARGYDARGTVGTGVGEAFLDSELRPELALYARDLGRLDIRDRLAAVRDQKRRDLAAIMDADFLPDDWDELNKELSLLESDDFLEWVAEEFRKTSRLVRIVDGDYLRREIFSRDGSIVVESSHGVLTDRYYGFTPHTSKLRTIPNIISWGLLEEEGYDGDIVRLGVTRAYAIRHGAGPLVTDKYGMIGVAGIRPDECSPADRYRGAVRVGALDCVALRYAINVCGGPEKFDGIAVNWFDRVETLGLWEYCHHYRNACDPEFFTPEGEIRVVRGVDESQLRRQEKLGKLLGKCRPDLHTFVMLPGTTRREVIALCANTLKEQLNVPVRMISFGGTENDKILL